MSVKANTIEERKRRICEMGGGGEGGEEDRRKGQRNQFQTRRDGKCDGYLMNQKSNGNLNSLVLLAGSVCFLIKPRSPAL